MANLQHCCTTNITLTTGSEDALKSRNREFTWETREMHKEFYLGTLNGEDCAGELSVDRKICKVESEGYRVQNILFDLIGITALSCEE